MRAKDKQAFVKSIDVYPSAVDVCVDLITRDEGWLKAKKMINPLSGYDCSSRQYEIFEYNFTFIDFFVEEKYRTRSKKEEEEHHTLFYFF